MMDWNSIKYFLAIVDNGNVKKAAKFLGISDSTVFRQLNTLEDKFGPIFERRAAGYSLTVRGRELYAIAQKAQMSFHDMERKSADFDEKISGRVRITAPASFAYSLLPEIVSRVNHAHPEINIELLVDNEIVNLVAHHADIALRVATRPPDQLIAKPLGEYEWSLYSNNTFVQTLPEIHSLSDISSTRVIGASGLLETHRAYKWLENSFDNIGHRANDFFAMRAFAFEGHGLALLPRDFESSGLRKVMEVDELGTNKLWLLLHPDLRGVRHVRVVTELIEGFFQEARQSELSK